MTDAQATTLSSSERLQKLGESLARLSLLDDDSKLPTDRNALVRYQALILSALQKLGDAKLELPTRDASTDTPQQEAEHSAYARRVLDALTRLLARAPQAWRRPPPSFMPLLAKSVAAVSAHVEALELPPA